MIDFSRAVYANSSVQAASQEAARAVIVKDDATSAAHARMVGLNADSAAIVINNMADMVEVTVSYESLLLQSVFATTLLHESVMSK